MPKKSFKKEWRNKFYFEIGWHFGWKTYYLSVDEMTAQPSVAKDYFNYRPLEYGKHETYADAFNELRKYGYGNSIRFITGD